MPKYAISRKTNRLPGRNYASEGFYFITICTEGRVYLLGSKEDDAICLSKTGKQVFQSWQKIGSMYQGIVLDVFAVMPNHIHGIIVCCPSDTDSSTPLSKIIRDFKSFTTHEYYKDKSRLTGNLWQRGYYERVVRYKELDGIREYIVKNPADWENDEFFEREKAYGQTGKSAADCSM